MGESFLQIMFWKYRYGSEIQYAGDDRVYLFRVLVSDNDGEDRRNIKYRGG